MTTQKSTNKEQIKQDKMDKTINSLITVSAAISAILVVEFIGVIALKLFHCPIHSFIYNFVFGFGIITGITFLVAAIQELLDK